MKTYSLGDTLIDVADFLETRIEEETLVAYFPQSDFANARFSKITLLKDGNEVPNAGKEMIQARAAKFGLAISDEGDRVWYFTSQESSEGTPGSMIHYWYVGIASHVVVVSCFMDSAKSDTEEAKRVLKSIPASVKSIRQKTKSNKRH